MAADQIRPGPHRNRGLVTALGVVGYAVIVGIVVNYLRDVIAFL